MLPHIIAGLTQSRMPRLKGASLRNLRRLIQTEPFRSIARAKTRADYQVAEMMALPVEARQYFDEHPEPVAGAGPRQWGDAEYAPPSPGDHRETISDLARAYRAGELDPVAVLEHILDRETNSDFGDSTYSPFVSIDEERARTAAEASRDRWRAGEPLGPLDGIPVPVKDHHHMEGLPTRSGTAFMNERPEVDSIAVERLEDAGAVLIGKTHVTEWGMQPTGYNPHFDMPRNVYSGEHAAGGSSTGTATAVALGLAPVGLGSDGGGSIRIPSAVNGLFGIKPSFLRIGRTGDAWATSTVSHNGPIGQSVADLVEFLAVTGAEPDPNDYATQYAPAVSDLADSWRAALGRGIDGARIGLWSWAWEQADPDIAEICRAALAELERDGAELVDLEIPYSQYHQSLGVLAIGVEAVGLLHDAVHYFGEETSEDLRLIIEALSTIDARDYMIARRTRAGLRRSLADAIRTVDLIAMPTVNMTAPRYTLAEDGTAIYDEHATTQLCRFAFLGNITGLPAGTVPVGMKDGLPVGLQLMGDAWDEASVFAAMAHCERMGLSDLPAPRRYGVAR
jgi:aspartyl-tRNA(Asn)/glutamyl-tRNA(Gln) amidotransferase subunit A